MSRNKSPHDLTDEEIALLKSTGVPNEVRAYLARQHENVGTKVSAYRKVAAAARAEAEAMIAVRLLDEVQDESVKLERLKAEVAHLRTQRDALEATVHQKDERIMQITAGPALVVHAGGTGK